MSRLSVDVTDNKTFVTVSETNNSVTIDRSDNPISVETSLTLIGGEAQNITVAANGVIPAGSLQNALQVLADQFYRGTDAPSNSNLDEGDLWYDTDDNQLKVYRETSTNTFEFVPLAQASGTMDSLDGGGF
jgi:hypothetical protein|tara:strand:+ start:728 stop:1120 length:393 start_codon:yes stop_codon:yes gene_type:complete